MNKIKYIILVGSLPPPYYGVTIINQMILNNIKLPNIDLILYDISHHQQLESIEKVNIHNILATLKHIIKLPFILCSYKPGIVYLPICQTIRGLFRDTILILISRFYGCKVVAHLHGSYIRELYNNTNVIGKILIKLVNKNIYRIILLDEFLRSLYDKWIDARRISIINNGLEDMYNINQIKNSHIQILYLSALAQPKGYLDLLETVPLVCRKEKNARFVFSGYKWNDDDEDNKATNIIKKNKIENFIQFTGPVMGLEKEILYNKSDIFVLPSYKEGQPLSIIEAMSAGLPIITTDTGAIKTMVIDGENGFIVDKGKPHQIADKIIYLILNPDIRIIMGKKSRERYLKYYTKDIFISKMTSLFQEVIYNHE